MMPIPPEREPIVTSAESAEMHFVLPVWHRFFISVWQFIRQIFPSLISTPLYVWDDLRFPATRGFVNPTTAKPVFDEVNVALVLEPNFSNNITFIGQLPHAYMANGTIHPHIHYRADSTSTANFVMAFQYKWYNNNTVPTAWTNSNVSIAPPGVAEQATIAELDQINGMGKLESSIFKVKLRRNGAATDDTYATNIYLDEFDIHYPVEKLGSGPEYPGE